MQRSHIINMAKKSRSPYEKRGGVRLLTFITGVLLVIISPIIGAIPGPGFIIVFPIGLAMILKSSLGAKRLYARFQKRWPKYGRWTNMVLRRNRKKAGEEDDPAFAPQSERI